MSRLQNKVANLERRKQRIRAKLYGTAKRIRLTVSISNMHVSAQLIDDEIQDTGSGFNSWIKSYWHND